MASQTVAHGRGDATTRRRRTRRNHGGRNPTDLQMAFSPRQLAERLAWLLDEIDDRMDVCDGTDGEQRPNDWMSLATEYQRQWS